MVPAMVLLLMVAAVVLVPVAGWLGGWLGEEEGGRSVADLGRLLTSRGRNEKRVTVARGGAVLKVNPRVGLQE
ncbi:hypothetical protein HPP92_027243 [Vanilla planifolia]|nr:hypothetical protein HPP92_027243 [Vanilla planifolia]